VQKKGKQSKFAPMLTQVPLHEDVWETGIKTPWILNLVSFTPRPLYHRRKSLR